MTKQLTKGQSDTLFDLVCELVHERFEIKEFLQEVKDSWKEAARRELEELQNQINKMEE